MMNILSCRVVHGTLYCTIVQQIPFHNSAAVSFNLLLRTNARLSRMCLFRQYPTDVGRGTETQVMVYAWLIQHDLSSPARLNLAGFAESYHSLLWTTNKLVILPHTSSTGSRPHIPTYEVSHHTVQLRSFLTTVGISALASVTSLQLTGNSTGGGKPSLPAAVVLAHLLAAACPKLTHLTAGGSTREAVLRVFGARCPNIRSLELPCGDDAGGLYRFLDFDLDGNPHTPLSQHQSQRSSCFAALASFPRLLRLSTQGRHHLTHAKDWLALPPSLEELRCHAIPEDLLPLLSRGLKLGALRTLHLTSNFGECWNVEVLSAFLEAAPKLQSITSSACQGRNSIEISSVSVMHVQAMQRVNLRLQAGLQVDQLTLRCGLDTLPEGSKVCSTEYLLARLFPFPKFFSCRLTTKAASPTPGCLAQLGRAFPCIRSLALSGNFLDMHLADLSTCRHLSDLNFSNAKLLTTAGLARHVVMSPLVMRVQHSFGNVIKTQELHALLAAARTADVGGTVEDLSLPEFGSQKIPWVAENSSFGFGLGRNLWVRRQSIVPILGKKHTRSPTLPESLLPTHDDADVSLWQGFTGLWPLHL